MNVRCPNCEQPFEFHDHSELDEISCPTCGSIFSLLGDAPTTADVGQSAFSIAHYDVLEVLGTGHFGRVLRARDLKLDREVALKLPHREKLSARELEFFLREARSASQLNHPNVVTVYEVGRTDESVYIATEFINGLTLGDWTELRQPSIEACAEMCETIALAIQHGHDRGVIHRDLKPTNILVDNSDSPHVADFGLAKRDGFEATIAVDGKILGTPAYMPPEQASGKGHEADARSDIYSLGVILYEMLTRKRPFVGGRRVLLHQVIYDPPKTLRSHRRDIPRDLENICLKCLEKDPRKRYQTAQELAEDLKRFRSGETVKARPVSLPERGLRFCRRYPARVIAFLLAFVIVALVLVMLNIESFAAPHPDSRLVTVGGLEPGTELVFVPIDAATNLPKYESAIKSNKRGRPTRLMPGQYIVIAVNGDAFHEVYRIVPTEGQIPGIYKHQKWEIVDGEVQIPQIELFTNDELKDWMRSVKGGKFETTSNGTTRGTVTVADFLVDRFEWGPPANEYMPEVNIPWDRAAEIAEQEGKRLLTDAEFVYLATKGGTSRYPWGNEPPEPNNFRLRPVDQRTSDVLQWERVDGEVFGLYSNALEWTSSIPSDKSMSDLAIVQGGPEFTNESILDGTYDPEDTKLLAVYSNASISERLFFNRIATNPSLGCRFARSAKPFTIE